MGAEEGSNASRFFSSEAALEYMEHSVIRKAQIILGPYQTDNVSAKHNLIYLYLKSFFSAMSTSPPFLNSPYSSLASIHLTSIQKSSNSIQVHKVISIDGHTYMAIVPYEDFILFINNITQFP